MSIILHYTKQFITLTLVAASKFILRNEPLREREERFCCDCQKFVVELCAQMCQIFIVDEDDTLAMLRAFNPKEALSPQRSLRSITKLTVNFPPVIKDRLKYE